MILLEQNKKKASTVQKNVTLELCTGKLIKAHWKIFFFLKEKKWSMVEDHG